MSTVRKTKSSVAKTKSSVSKQEKTSALKKELKKKTSVVQNKKRKVERRGIVITGASSGIGYAFAKYCVETLSKQVKKNTLEEQVVVMVSRNQKRLTDARRELEKSYPQVKILAHAVDLSRQGSAKKLWDFCKKQKLHVHMLINNAGFGHIGSFKSMDLAFLQEMMNVNMNSLAELSYYFVNAMRRGEDKGTLVNVASGAAFQCVPYMALYAATKAFVLHFTEGLAEEFRDTNLQVLAICPGLTETSFFDVAVSKHQKKNWLDFSKKRSKRAPEDVVKTTMEALLAGQKGYVIDGGTTRLMTAMSGFFPRRLAAKTTARMLKKLR